MISSPFSVRRLPMQLTTFALFSLWGAGCGDDPDSAPGISTGGARSGGDLSNGGSTAGGAITGGNTSTGGNPGSGGVKPGGMIATGGIANPGGTITTGGKPGTGGSSDGGQPPRAEAGTPDMGSRDSNQPGQPDAGVSDGGPVGTAAVQLRGRFDKYDSTPAMFGWTGSAIVARFNGTGATVQLSGTDDRYQVIIDGVVSTTILKVTASGKFEVAKGLPAGTHELMLWRRTEGNWSQSSYLGIEITGGQLLAPPAYPDRRIEIYGDSITAGYGVDGVGPSCSVSQDNSNNFLSYGSVAARTLNADLHTVAWSGIGMYRGYGETIPAANSTTMPMVYDRILPQAPSYPVMDNAWNFASWQPHAVVINLGTNDASSKGDPGQPYRTIYLDFVRGLRKKYPDTFFVLTIGPMLDGASLTAVRTHLQEIIKTRASEGDTKMSYLEYPVQVAADGYGCDWHPSAATQAKMATLLVAELKKRLSW